MEEQLQQPKYDEIFNAAGVATGIQKLDSAFDSFAQTLSDVNSNVIQALINNGPNSAIFGEVGTKLKAEFDKISVTFPNFRNNLDEWNKVISIIAAKNEEYTIETNNTYKEISQDGIYGELSSSGTTNDGETSILETRNQFASGELLQEDVMDRINSSSLGSKESE